MSGLRPGGAVTGPVRLPCSKSIAQRMLVCGALARGETRLRGVTWSEDVSSVTRALRGLSVEIDGVGSGALTIHGRPPGVHGWQPRRPARPSALGTSGTSAGGPTPTRARGEAGIEAGARPVDVELGESGTGARLLTAGVALCGPPGEPVVLDAAGSLRARSSPALLDALRAAGAEFQFIGGPRAPWPLRVLARGPASSLRLVEPRSSQELSALLVACAAWPGEFEVRVEGALPSAPYAAMTLSVLERFGARVTAPAHPPLPGPGSGSGSWLVRGPLSAPPDPVELEPDASAAAVALAAGCLSGGEVHVPGLTPASLQGDVRIAEYLRAFGCDARLAADGLRASGAPTRGARVDLSGEPDLAPVLAVVAAAAARGHGCTSRLSGLGNLRYKESSRIEVLGGALARLGFAVEAGDEELSVGPGPGPGPARRDDLWLDPHADHRMAFAFALLGLLVPGVHVLAPDCVGKSWPGFWQELAAAGAKTLPVG